MLIIKSLNLISFQSWTYLHNQLFVTTENAFCVNQCSLHQVFSRLFSAWAQSCEKLNNFKMYFVFLKFKKNFITIDDTKCLWKFFWHLTGTSIASPQNSKCNSFVQRRSLSFSCLQGGRFTTKCYIVPSTT